MSAVATASNGSGPPNPPEEPPASSGEDLFAEFMALAPRATEYLERLDREREEEDRRHAEAIGEITEKRRRIKALLKDLGHEEPQRPRPRGRRVSARSGEEYRPAPRVFIPILEAVLAKAEYFTALGIHEEIDADWSQPHTYVAFKQLHEMEILGKVRKEGGRSSRMLYRVLDREATEELLRKLREGVNA